MFEFFFSLSPTSRIRGHVQKDRIMWHADNGAEVYHYLHREYVYDDILYDPPVNLNYPSSSVHTINKNDIVSLSCSIHVTPYDPPPPPTPLYEKRDEIDDNKYDKYKNCNKWSNLNMKVWVWVWLHNLKHMKKKHERFWNLILLRSKIR